MEIDDLMQDIIEAVRDRDDHMTRNDALDIELKAKEDSIVSKFMEAKEYFEEHGYDAHRMHKILQKDK